MSPDHVEHEHRAQRRRGAGRRLRLLGIASVAIAGIVGFTGCAQNDAGPGYAALGDSYASGPLIPKQLHDPLGCLRSDHDYPHLIASDVGLHLTDVTCSGATTVNITRGQRVPLGWNPPQLNAVTKNTEVVTLSIGGNDIGFGSIVANCIASSPTGPTKVGPTCKSYYTAGGTDKLVAATNMAGVKIANVLRLIRQQAAPDAKVFVVGYSAILPGRGTGCWPQMPLTRTDVPYLRGVEVGLNNTLRHVTEAAGATFVDVYQASLAHNACTAPATRWIEPVVPSTAAAPLHPNATGEAAIARIAEATMLQSGVG